MTDRDGMREVELFGGLARFWVPEYWEEEPDGPDGACFYDPESEGTLRLSVLSFDTGGKGWLRMPRRPGERQLDGGTLPNGCEFDVYESDTVEDGEPLRVRYWQIAQGLPDLCRIFLFSYAYPVDAEDELADELEMLDEELPAVLISGDADAIEAVK